MGEAFWGCDFHRRAGDERGGGFEADGGFFGFKRVDHEQVVCSGDAAAGIGDGPCVCVLCEGVEEFGGQDIGAGEDGLPCAVVPCGQGGHAGIRVAGEDGGFWIVYAQAAFGEAKALGGGVDFAEGLCDGVVFVEGGAVCGGGGFGGLEVDPDGFGDVGETALGVLEQSCVLLEDEDTAGGFKFVDLGGNGGVEVELVEEDVEPGRGDAGGAEVVGVVGAVRDAGGV